VAGGDARWVLTDKVSAKSTKKTLRSTSRSNKSQISREGRLGRDASVRGGGRHAEVWKRAIEQDCP
jgi:hypothetical protein